MHVSIYLRIDHLDRTNAKPTTTFLKRVLSSRFFYFRDDQMANIGKYNFDHPDAFDWELAREVI